MAATKDPFKNSQFRVEIDGIGQSSFSEVVLPDASTDIIEYRNGGESPILHKMPGLHRYSNILLKWEMTGSMELYNWDKEVEDGKISSIRKKIAVTILDEQGIEVARWSFVNAWPVKYTPPLLKAQGDEIAIEKLEIAHEGLVRTK